MARPTGHPLAGQVMTGAQMLVQVLADEGVTAIFGYSGGAILPTYDAVFLFNEQAQAQGTRQVPLIVPANEQGAGFMAAGYARATGKVGVCLVTSGPGATNTVTPVRDCMADSIPDRRHLRPGRDGRHRYRCIPGGPGGLADGCGGEAHFPGHGSHQARSDAAHGVRDRPHRSARPGGGGRTEGCPELAGPLYGHRNLARPRLPQPDRESGARQPHRGGRRPLLRIAQRRKAAR